MPGHCQIIGVSGLFIFTYTINQLVTPLSRIDKPAGIIYIDQGVNIDLRSLFFKMEKINGAAPPGYIRYITKVVVLLHTLIEPAVGVAIKEKIS